VHVVPFGLDYSRFHERPPAAAEIRRKYGERFLIFALGRHVYYKGFEYLVRAMKALDGMLMIGGRGPLTQELKALCRTLEVEARVHFVDRIPESDLPAYYHACDVFCMPSIATAEAFGLVQLEAMACGKAVVCCQLGNGVNWVNLDGVTGFAVPPRDSAALARVLQRLKDDAPLRQRIGAAAREHALKRFSSDAMASATLAVYRKVLGRPPGSATA
jgi:rhamnosyl/mannosyltransferase